MTPSRVIGHRGTLPWHLPEDLAFFRRTTLEHPVVMGRRTFESIGRPLPKRRNIVLTRDHGWVAEGVEVIHHPADLEQLVMGKSRVFIIGGAEIYEAFMPLIDDLLISHVFAEYEGDTRFPEFERDFALGEIIETHPQFEVRRWARSDPGPAV